MSELHRTACWVAAVVFLSAAGCSESAFGPSDEAAAEASRGMIVFADDQVIWRIQPDGSGLKAVGRDGRRPILSPDLSRLGLTAFDGRPAIADLDGSGLEFVDDSHGPLDGWIGSETLVFRASLDSVVVHMLGDGSRETIYRAPGFSLLSAADVSPDGRRLVVAQLQAPEALGIVLRRLEPEEEPEEVLQMPGRFVRTLRFSPDGRSLAIGSVDDRSFSERSSAVTVLDLESGSTRVLRPTDPAHGYRWPTWTPDGDSLLVNRLRVEPPFFETSDLVVVSLADGGERLLLGDHEGQIRGPHWRAPDG